MQSYFKTIFKSTVSILGYNSWSHFYSEIQIQKHIKLTDIKNQSVLNFLFFPKKYINLEITIREKSLTIHFEFKFILQHVTYLSKKEQILLDTKSL